jgi:hypothetical protein
MFAGLMDYVCRPLHVTVGTLLKELGYSLQGNRKTLEGSNHPDRNKQFEFINEKIKTALAT